MKKESKLFAYAKRFKVVLAIASSVMLWQIAFVIYNHDLYYSYNHMPISGKVILEAVLVWFFIDLYKFLKPKYYLLIESKWYAERKLMITWLVKKSLRFALAVSKFLLAWGFVTLGIMQPLWLIIKHAL
ncbi:hypothetical protein [Pseudomonas veronii]